jgi:hypothetical protein
MMFLTNKAWILKVSWIDKVWVHQIKGDSYSNFKSSNKALKNIKKTHKTLIC